MRLPRLFIVLLLLAGLAARGSAQGAHPEADVRRVLTLLNLVAEEYREGVADGRVVMPVEYDEAKAFLHEAADRSRVFVPDLEPRFAAVYSRLEALAPLEEVDAALADLSAEITARTGVALQVFPEQPPSVARGAALYRENCTACHGEAANGKGPAAAGLEPPPADFTDTSFMRFETPYDFFHVVSAGKGGSAMPAWSEVLSLQERWDVVSYLWTVPSSHDRLAEGQGIYLAHCAGCHGAAGDGRGAYSAALVKPVPDLSAPALLARKSDADLFDVVSNGVPGTPMPAFQRTLSEAERWAAVAFVRQLSLGGVAFLAQPQADVTVDPRRFAGLLNLVASEYAKSVSPDGQINTVELTEASILLDQARAQLPAVASLLGAKSQADGERLRAEIDALGSAVRDRDAVAAVAARVAEVQKILAPYLPETATAATAAPSGLVETRKLLEDALAAYDRGDPAAAYRVSDAYFAFEPVEKSLSLVDADLTRGIEALFLDLRGLVSAPGNQEAVRATVADIGERLDRAAALLRPGAPDPFSIGFQAAVIILREGFEVVLLIGALLAYVVKSGNAHMRRPIWIGTMSGIAVSVLTAFAFLLLYTSASGPAVEALEGITMLLASVVLFWVSYWLISKAEAERWQRFIQGKVQSALSRGSRWALVGTAFLAVYREGVETVLFYQALIGTAGTQLTSVGAGILSGGVILAIVSVAFIRFGMKLPLRPFFLATSSLLYSFAVIFAGRGVAELQEAGWIPITPLAWAPRIDLFGIYPTAQTLAAQGVFVLLLAYAIFVLLRRKHGDAAVGQPVRRAGTAR